MGDRYGTSDNNGILIRISIWTRAREHDTHVYAPIHCLCVSRYIVCNYTVVRLRQAGDELRSSVVGWQMEIWICLT